jgi:carboxylesterase type B
MLFTLGAASLSLAVLAAAQTVKTLNGTIQGGRCNSTAVNYFLSIPYAKPPLGNLRFAPPQVYDQAYNGTLQATNPAMTCVQFGNGFFESPLPTSEDW